MQTLSYMAIWLHNASVGARLENEQEYIIKEGREYQMLLYRALNVCGESRAWNVDNRCTSP